MPGSAGTPAGTTEPVSWRARIHHFVLELVDDDLRPLRPLPSPYPVTTTVTRTASAQALVSFAGDLYSVPPELARATVVVTVVHGEPHPQIAPAASPAGSWPGTDC